MKKLISTVAAFIILISNIVTASALYKKSDTDVTEAVYLAKTLGFIEENIDVKRELTRGELAQIIAYFTGYSEEGRDMIISRRNSNSLGKTVVYDYKVIDGKPIFSDVPAGYWGVGYIEYVALSGYMSGSPDDKYKFQPNDPAKPQDLYEPLVKMLGYGEFIEEKGVEQCAVEAEINVNTGGTLTAENVAEILYKALHAELYTKKVSGTKTSYQKEGLLMQELFDMGYVKNVRIENNAYTSITGSALTKEYAFEAGGEVYSDPENFSKDALGYIVDLYYTEDNDGEKTAVAMISKADEEVSFVSDDLISITKDEVRYFNEKGSKKSEKLNGAPDVLYNGQLLRGWNYKTLSGMKDAEFTFVDTDKDGRFDLVNIKDYKYMIVDSVNADKFKVQSNTVFPENSQGLTILNLDEKVNGLKQIVTYRKDGVACDFSAITAGCMLSVLKGKGDHGVVVIDVEIESGGKTISVDSFNTGNAENPGSVTSGGKEYKLAPGFYESGSKINGTGAGKVYLTKQNKIFKFIATASGGREYGFIRNIFRDEDSDGEYVIKMFTQDGTWVNFRTGLKLSVNNNRMDTAKALSSSGIASIANDGKVLSVNYQLVRYTYDAKTITNIETVQVDIDAMLDDESVTPEQIEARLEEAVTNDEFRLVHVGKKSDTKRQLRDMGSLNSLSRVVTKSSSIITFCMPDDPGNASDEDFVIKSWPYLYNTLVNCESYDEDMFGVPKAMVYYSGTGGSSDAVNSEYLMVSGVNRVFDEDEGGEAYNIKGVVKGKEVSYVVTSLLMNDAEKASIIKNLKEGSLVQVALNIQNKVSNISVVFDMSDWENRSMITYGSIGSRGRMCGTVVKIDVNNARLRIMGEKDASVGNNVARIATMMANPYIMLYDGEAREGSRVRVAKFSEVSVDDYVIIRTFDSRMESLFIYKNVE